jgi:hypothetical protein
MTLSPRNWLVRFAFIGSDWGVPTQTSLCALFWRIVWRTVIALFILAVVTGVLYQCYLHPWNALQGVAIAIITIGVLIGFFFVKEWFDDSICACSVCAKKPLTPIREAVYAIKNRFCPIIKITADKE